MSQVTYDMAKYGDHDDAAYAYGAHFGVEEITYEDWLKICPSNVDEKKLDELLKKVYPEWFL